MKTVYSAFLGLSKQLGVCFGVLICLWLPYPGAVAAEPTLVEQQTTSALKSFHEGKILTAINTLERAATENQSLPTAERYALLTLLLEMCAAVEYQDCMHTHVETLTKAFPPPDSETATPVERLRYFGSAYFVYYLLYLDYWSMPPSAQHKLVQNLDNGALTKYPYPLDFPVLYVQGQILAARIYGVAEQFEKAVTSLDRALAVIAARRDIQPYYLAKWLSDIELLLYEFGDTVRAERLHVTSQEFILNNTGSKLLLLSQAELMYLRRMHWPISDAKSLIPDAALALSVVKELELPDETRKRWMNDLSMRLCQICAVAGEHECAEGALKEAPATQDLEGFLKNGEFTSEYAAYYIATAVFVRHRAGEQIPADWLQAMKRYVERPASSNRYLRNLGSLVQLVVGFQSYGTDRTGSMPHLIASAKTRLELFQEIRNRLPAAFPMPNLADRISVQSTLFALSDDRHIDPSLGDTVLALFEMYNRSLRQADSEVLARLSYTGTLDSRRLVHAYLRLASRNIYAERAEIRRALDFAGTKGAKPENQNELVAVHRYLADFSIKKKQIREDPMVANALQGTALRMPSLESLQRMLREGEAYVSIAGAYENIIHLCVTKTSVSVRKTPVDVAQFGRDLQLLQNALTATHAPNPVLDSQFPVAAARHAYRIFVEPVSDCLRGTTHLIWSPPGFLLSIPIGVFLESDPQKTKDGYRLADAGWVARRYAISYVTSAQGFIAARKLGQREQAQFPYLGVGDPVLSGRTADGTDRKTVLASRSAGNAGNPLMDLWELPETSRELTDSSKMAGPSAKVLLRGEATEGRFRREVLDRYEVLHFATHGLLREEVKGIVEPALVLTPQSATSESNDGALTASEIANLNLGAKFAVLSACNSANFDLTVFASEVQGLTTSFALAGVPSTLATLWAVETEATRRLITNLFAHYYSNTSGAPAEALRQSTIDFLSSPPQPAMAHPRFWGAFVIYGDGGGIPRQAAPLRSERTIGEVLTGDYQGGSETYAVRSSEDGALYLTGIAGKSGQRFKSFVARADRTGKLIWFRDDAKLGATHVLVPTSYGALSAGYLSSQAGEQNEPVVYAFDSNGTRLWSRSLKGINGIPFGGIRANEHDEAIIGILENASAEKQNKKSVTLLRLSKSGETLASTQFSIKDEATVVSVILRSTDKYLVVAVNEWSSSSEENYRPNDFGVLEGCGQIGSQSRLTFFDRKNAQAINEVLLPRFNIADLTQAASGGLLVAGSVTKGCSIKDRAAAIAEIDQKGLKSEIYVEKSPFESEATVLLPMRDGRVMVLGQSIRPYDLDSPHGRPEVGSAGYLDSLQDWTERRDRHELSDGVMMILDRSGKVLSRDLLTTGAQVFFLSAAKSGDSIIAVGSNGFQMLWANAALRPH